MNMMSYDLKQKSSEIKSILSKKVELTSDEKYERFSYAMYHFFDDLFMAEANTVYMMRTLGRGTPEDGIIYTIRAKKHFKNEFKNISNYIDKIADTGNSSEKYELIHNISMLDCDLYNLECVIKKLTKRYNCEDDKLLLKSMAKKPEVYSYPINLEAVLMSKKWQSMLVEQ